ncbi:MAG: redox-sensitive bicupin YhaK (pirin superfamily) [Bacteriovoracaceae bacterium]|jgi:redox-sensitive bicupin YhaK (pirin superfamily)
MIEAIIKPLTKELGDGFSVRRSLPDKKKKMVGPFIFWDHMGPVTLDGNKEMLVRPHPHIGLATVTYLFSGEILHRDSLGNEQLIKPGEVNWMTAGAGIVHSERARNTSLEGIQLWVALPKAKEKIAPSFVHIKEDELPELNCSGVDLRLIVGSFLGAESPIPVHSDIFYLSAKSHKTSQLKIELGSDQEAGVYLIKGTLEIESNKIEPGTMVIFQKGSEIKVDSIGASEFMIFGGEEFKEKPSVWWNFSSHSFDNIEEAKKKWKEGKFPKSDL